MEKDKLLQKIFKLKADACDLELKANKLGQEYTGKYTTFEVGQKIIIEDCGNAYNAIINRIFFDEHSELPAFSKLVVTLYKRDFKTILENRNRLFISRKSQIVKTEI